MKKTLHIVSVIVIFFLASCGGNDQQTDPASTNAAAGGGQSVSDTVLVDSAKRLIDDANRKVENGMRNKIPVEKVNAELRPIMAKYRQLTARMAASDTLIIHEYRIDGANKLINLQIELDSKKK